MTKPHLADPGRAVAYLRVSTEDQRLGPEAQREQIGRWAERAGVGIVAWHTDQGVSGGAELATRPALVAALGELRAVGAGLLVVAKRDRLARDVAIALAIERAVSASGAHVMSADGVANGDDPSDAFLRNILHAAAQYERALIGLRTRAALQTKRARGEQTGNLPWGWTVDPDGGAKLVADAREQEIFATICALRAEGHTLRQIVVACQDRCLYGRRGRPLTLTTIATLLRRPLTEKLYLPLPTLPPPKKAERNATK